MFYRTVALQNLKNTDLTIMEIFSSITNKETTHHAAFNDYHDAKYFNNATYQPIKSIPPPKFVLTVDEILSTTLPCSCVFSNQIMGDTTGITLKSHSTVKTENHNLFYEEKHTIKFQCDLFLLYAPTITS